MAANKHLVVGPSHVVRLKQLVQSGGLANSFEPDLLVGYGGAPTWSKRLFDEVARKADASTQIHMLVGDFRFGNAICLPGNKPKELFVEGVNAVNAAAVSPENDLAMRARAFEGLRAWNAAYKGRINFLFWDVFCRQVQDRLAGKYISEGQYRHPTWNLADVERELSDLSVVSLSQILNQPMHEAMRLFIDASNHPSGAGYVFMQNVFLRGLPVMDSYRNGLAAAQSWIVHAMEKLRSRTGKDVLLTGTSIWLDTLMRYLGPVGAEAVRECGVIIHPLNRQVGFPYETPKAADDAACFFVSAGPLSSAEAEASATGYFRRAFAAGIRVATWEQHCAPIITARRETPQFLYPVKGAAAQVSPLTEKDVELGPGGLPTLRGLLGMIDSL